MRGLVQDRETAEAASFQLALPALPGLSGLVVFHCSFPVKKRDGPTTSPLEGKARRPHSARPEQHAMNFVYQFLEVPHGPEATKCSKTSQSDRRKAHQIRPPRTIANLNATPTTPARSDPAMQKHLS